MDTVEFEVAGTTFYYKRLDPFAALEMLGDLQKDVLPSLGGLLSLIGNDDEEDNVEAMTNALANLSSNLSGAHLRKWTEKLLTKERVSVDVAGETKRLDAATRAMVFDSFTEILELMGHIVKLEFADPLARWLGHIGLGQKFQEALLEATAETPSKSS